MKKILALLLKTYIMLQSIQAGGSQSSLKTSSSSEEEEEWETKVIANPCYLRVVNVITRQTIPDAYVSYDGGKTKAYITFWNSIYNLRDIRCRILEEFMYDPDKINPRFLRNLKRNQNIPIEEVKSKKLMMLLSDLGEGEDEFPRNYLLLDIFDEDCFGPYGYYLFSEIARLGSDFYRSWGEDDNDLKKKIFRFKGKILRAFEKNGNEIKKFKVLTPVLRPHPGVPNKILRDAYFKFEDITLTIHDENGKPIPGAVIVVS